MTGLGQWLAGVLNRHIERHNTAGIDYGFPPDRIHLGQLGGVTVAEAGENFQRNMDALREALGAQPAEALGVMRAELAAAVAEPRQRLRDVPTAIGRPCWACGDPVGFHAFHLPCCDTVGAALPRAPWDRPISDGSTT